jgi:hypothetical protein
MKDNKINLNSKYIKTINQVVATSIINEPFMVETSGTYIYILRIIRNSSAKHITLFYYGTPKSIDEVDICIYYNQVMIRDFYCKINDLKETLQGLLETEF